MKQGRKSARDLAAVLLCSSIFGASAVVCYQVSHSNAIEACGCVLWEKSPPGSLCAYEAWSAPDATCDCGQVTCMETDATLNAVKSICIGVCGQNKCDLIDTGPPSIETYHVHVVGGSCGGGG